MNISPISFGKVVRVNGSKNAAQCAVKSINNSKDSKTNLSVQKDLKRIFNDTKAGEAQVVALNPREVYILSGQESKEADALSRDVLCEIDRAAEQFGPGELLDIEIDVQSDYHAIRLRNLIDENLEKKKLNLSYNRTADAITYIDFKA